MVPAPATHPSVIIIGAGTIGLSIAWKLALAGARVSVFDKGLAGRGATHAAGGMLAACVETEPGEEGLVPLTRASQALWPDFVDQLERATGQSVELRRDGTLVIAQTADDAARLRFLFDLQRGLGLPVDWLSGAEVRRREPYLQPGIVGALACAQDHQVDNRKLALALVAAVRQCGVSLHEETAVTRIETGDGRVRGVMVAAGGGEERFVGADHVVLAAGAWSGSIPGLPREARPPVRPIKGQMICLRMNPDQPLLRHVVWTPGTYLIPRNDGRLLIGATTEERGFDQTLTAGGQFALLEGAWRALPGIAELPIDEAWVGFRPGSRDDAPVLGLTPIDGLVLATGHHRNGILLTPVTADAIARLILTGVVDPVIAEFGLDRFDKKGRAA